MKVTIIGAGAIGGLAGTHMARAGYDVMLVDRWAEHVEAINKNGMLIDGIHGEMTIPAKAITPDQLEDYVKRTGALEAVLIATKSQHTEMALRQLLPFFGTDTFVVSYQNGFNEPMIAQVLEPRTRCRGLIVLQKMFTCCIPVAPPVCQKGSCIPVARSASFLWPWGLVAGE